MLVIMVAGGDMALNGNKESAAALFLKHTDIFSPAVLQANLNNKTRDKEEESGSKVKFEK